MSSNKLEELVQNPNKGHKIRHQKKLDKIKEEHGSKEVESSRWVKMSRDVIEGSRGKTREVQLALAASKGARAPRVLEAEMACYIEHAVTGKKLLPRTFTVCLEMVQGCPYKLVVGGFSASGLFVKYFAGCDDGIVGVVALWEF